MFVFVLKEKKLQLKLKVLTFTLIELSSEKKTHVFLITDHLVIY